MPPVAGAVLSLVESEPVPTSFSSFTTEVMKHTTLIAGALLALTAPVAAQWSDNFESYAANTVLDNVGGWFGWDNTPAAAGSVDATLSRSFPNSIHCGPGTDAVHPQIGITSGKWTVTAWQYIPSPQTGDVYLVMNNTYNHGGPWTWVTELQADVTTGTVIDDLRGGTPQPTVLDAWVEYRLDVDLDANTCSSYYNGSMVSSGTWTGAWGGGGGPVAIENIDLFNNGGICNWDDISIAWRGDSFDTYPATTVLDNVGGWFGWDNTPAAAGSVDGTLARTGANSMHGSATTDAVHPNIGITGGHWSLTAWQYIATGGLTGGSVYFIGNNVYNHGGPYIWTIEVQANSLTGMVEDDLRAHTPQPILFDQWAEYRLDIDLDANRLTTFYNGVQLSQGVYTIGGGPAAIDNLDLFNFGGVCNWDDVCFRQVMPAPCYETDLGTALGMSDDQTIAQPLGFTFPFPGGSTTDIGICSNGFIWLDPAQTSTDFSNSVAEFLGSAQATPRIAAAWRDFNPGAGGSDDVYFNTFPDRAVITWHRVVRFGGSSPMTVQCQMLADGTVYVFYDANFDLTGGTASSSGRALTGIKAGIGGVADPGNTDYSAALPVQTAGSTVYEYFADVALFDLQGRCTCFTPNTLGGYDVSFRFDCGASATSYGIGCPAAFPVILTTSAPPVLGTTFTWDVAGVPRTVAGAAMMLGWGNANLSLDSLGWIGCSSYTTADFWGALPFTPPTAQLAFAVPITPTIVGLSIYSQAVIVEDATTLYTSNGMRLDFGKN